MVAPEKEKDAQTSKTAPKSTHAMRVMGQDGHSTHEWDPDDPEQVEAMRTLFNRMVRERRYVAYRMEAGGRRGEVIREFDPAAERMILAPQLQGGSR